MFKRVTWMGVGAVAGSAGTVYTQRKVKQQMERISKEIADKATPRQAAELAKQAALGVRDRVLPQRRAAQATSTVDVRESTSVRPVPESELQADSLTVREKVREVIAVVKR